MWRCLPFAVLFAFALPAAADAPAVPAEVLAAIAADAAHEPAPAPEADATAPDVPSSEAAASPEAHGTCSLRLAGQWQAHPDLNLAECVAALEASPIAPEAGSLAQAYWRGTFLAASRSAIYRSADGRDWSLLRERRSP